MSSAQSAVSPGGHAAAAGPPLLANSMSVVPMLPMVPVVPMAILPGWSPPGSSGDASGRIPWMSPAAAQGKAEPLGPRQKLTLWSALGGEQRWSQAGAASGAREQPEQPAPASSGGAEGAGGSGASPGSPQLRPVLWCGVVVPEAESMEALATRLEVGGRSRFLENASEFTRWLFEQPRGAVQPWAILVVAWRDAKPCAMAIAAAHSGDAGALRPDSRRAPLPPVLGDSGGPVHVAVKSMVIKLHQPEQEERAKVWLKSEGGRIANVAVHLVQDIAQMKVCLDLSLRPAAELGRAGHPRHNIMSL